jgi:hypothetical protein
MAKLRLVEEPLAIGPIGVGDRLAREAGILAGRIVDLLERHIPSPDAPIAAQLAALRAMFEVASSGRPVAEFKGSAIDRVPPGPVHPLDRLAGALQLSRFEVDLLMLSGQPDEHEVYAAALRSLHPRGEPRPTVGLAAQLFCESAAERELLRESLETGPGVKSGAMRLSADAPFFERSLSLAPSLWSALHGVACWPTGICPIEDPIHLFGLDEWLTSETLARARNVLSRRAPYTLIFTAETEEIACHRAGALSKYLGIPAVRLALEGPLTSELERLISIHTALRGVMPIVQVAPTEGAAAVAIPQFADHPGPVALCVRHGLHGLRGRRPSLSISVDRLTPTARQAMWSELLPELAEHAPRLAGRYSLEPHVAAAVAVDLRGIASVELREPSADDAASSVRIRAGVAGSGSMKLVHPTASWSNLVLPTDRVQQLREAVDRLILQAKVIDEWGFLRGRPGARGVRMLFAGPPGTGKTLSAEVLAHTLGVDLLVVDISRVVSKWIGETEKNLADVFDGAEQAQAVLLFDEADALFGKRTEVSDAHDRYANLETAYLLSRLERFEGLAVLSTNLRQNIDTAFTRRLEFIVDYEEPTVAEREALWRAHLPSGAPFASDVNLHELAIAYPVVGAVIRNAAVAAAFLAASEETPITRSHLMRAIRREYEKLGRAFPGSPGSNAPRKR